MIKLDSYYKHDEIKCPCCGYFEHDLPHLQKMFMLRVLTAKPIIINSWHRCQKHNKAVGSKTDNHLHGAATDIRCIDSWYRQLLLDAIHKVGFKRIGIHRTFIHVDSTLKSPTVWLYT